MDLLDELDQLIDGGLSELKSSVEEETERRSKIGLKQENRLVLDKNFNLVDSSGNVVKTAKPKSEFVVNQERERKKKAKKFRAKVSKIQNQTFFDPTLPKSTTATLGKRKRKINSFGFYMKGEIIQKAKRQRTRKLIDDQHKSVMESLGITSGVVELGDSQLITGLDDVPVVEPWDESFLKNGYTEIEEIDKYFDSMEEKEFDKRVNFSLVCHPRESKANYDVNRIVPLAVMLTKEEQRKLRKQTRMQKELEKQKKIRVGLLPKPAPKANLKNFMRVYLNDGTQMPTTLEKQIRHEVENRVREHDERNLSNKLTSEERREKKVNKNEEDMDEEVLTYVYKIKSLAHPYHRFKIKALAYKLVLTGCVIQIVGDDGEQSDDENSVNLFVVEGGKKNLRRFDAKVSKVEWNMSLDGNEKIDFELEENENLEPNRCKLMWKGSIPKKKFKRFHFRTFSDPISLMEFLRKYSIDNLYDICRTWMDK